MKKGKRSISFFSLAMLNVAVVMSLRGLPMMAKEGLFLVFFLLFAAFVFLIPTALISAELATGWPGGGGVYRWVSEAFGNRVGFIAIWLQWIQNVIWYPTVLAFAAGALSYLFLDPSLASSKVFNIIVILVVYWGATFVNFKGIKASGLLSGLGVILGTIVPGIFIIALGIGWYISGKPLAFDMTKGIIPDLSNFSTLSFLAGVVLLFAGMEVSAVHANEVKDPKKDYPKAIFLATLIILIIFSLGAFSIASVMPGDKILLTAGIMQAFRDFLRIYGLDFLLPLIGLLIAFGVIGGVAAWIVGPSKGLFATAKKGDLPPFLSRANKNGVPVNILVIQGLVVTFLSLLYLLMPTISSAFFLLTALTAILYLIMYILMYMSAIRLRYTKKNVERSYRLPFRNIGMWVVGGVGILGALFAILVGFFPPAQLTVGSPLFYVLFLIVGIVLNISIPYLMVSIKRRAKHGK